MGVHFHAYFKIKIYSAVNLDDEEFAKEKFREKRNKKYPNILKSAPKTLYIKKIFLANLFKSIDKIERVC